MLPKILWNSLLVTPAVLTATLIASTSAIASETSQSSESSDAFLPELAEISDVEEISVFDGENLEQSASAEPIQLAGVPAEPSASSLEESADAQDDSVYFLNQVQEYSSEGTVNSLGQVTSISQLSDVQPTDWAFQALQSLVERYGCIAGYPDGTYRGNRAMTRYEFAAGMNACLDRINELIAAGLADVVTREDLAVLQRLQEEFAAELATLRGRVDALEARVAEVEANQFSTTTKLNAEVIFAQEVPIDEPDGFDDETTFGYRVRMNFDTSFTGEDRLRTRFQARDLPDFSSDPIGRSFSGGGGGDFVLDDLVYTFTLLDVAAITIGANSIGADDYVVSTISPLDSSGGGSISNFGFPPQYNFIPGDAGAGAIIQITDALSLDFGYSSGEPSDPSPGAGLFNGDYGGIAQLTFLSDFIDAALTYSNSYAGDGLIFGDGPQVGNYYGGQFNVKLDIFEIGGGIFYANVNGIGANPDYETWSYQGTLAINDVLGEGNMIGVLAGVPTYSREFTGDDDFGDDTSFLLEGFYRYRLNDFISITPSVVWINDPFNDNDNDDAIIGHLRTTFSF
ncbi:MAG: iron uptake porin [Elainellaceae cyanobacterium]